MLQMKTNVSVFTLVEFTLYIYPLFFLFLKTHKQMEKDKYIVRHCGSSLKQTSASVFTGSQRKCPSHLYQCGSGECVDPGLVCNGLTNCADSSDEGVGCTRLNCSSPSAPRCDHHCVSTPNGAVSAQQSVHLVYSVQGC